MTDVERIEILEKQIQSLKTIVSAMWESFYFHQHNGKGTSEPRISKTTTSVVDQELAKL